MNKHLTVLIFQNNNIDKVISKMIKIGKVKISFVKSRFNELNKTDTIINIIFKLFFFTKKSISLAKLRFKEINQTLYDFFINFKV